MLKICTMHSSRQKSAILLLLVRNLIGVAKQIVGMIVRTDAGIHVPTGSDQVSLSGGTGLPTATADGELLGLSTIAIICVTN